MLKLDLGSAEDSCCASHGDLFFAHTHHSADVVPEDNYVEQEIT